MPVEGTGVYEIPVGPVHAGLIEAGHFRFFVAGETVLRLKARLWFVHRGVEKLFEGRPADDAVGLAERVSGDTSVAHALAHALAVEDALGVELPDEVHRLRALLVELELLYNHVADLGALANGVGFGLANAHALRDRAQLLRINAATAGDVLARYTVRRAEFAAATELDCRLIKNHCGPIRHTADAAPVHGSGVGIVEGWRGTVVHRVEIAADGRITRAKTVDPSWFNWPALPVAMARHHRPRLPVGRQKFQPVLRRQ